MTRIKKQLVSKRRLLESTTEEHRMPAPGEAASEETGGFYLEELGPRLWTVATRVEDDLAHLLKVFDAIARDLITATGQNADDWWKIRESADKLDQAYCAARVLEHLDTLRSGVAAGTATPFLVLEALHAGFALRDATIAEHEVAIAGNEKQRGPRGRRDPDRDGEMAREFKKRRLSSGLSDSALKEKIGEDERYGLGRSAAIAAINRGLGRKKPSG